MGSGWHPIYEMENKIHVWNHQPDRHSTDSLHLSAERTHSMQNEDRCLIDHDGVVCLRHGHSLLNKDSRYDLRSKHVGEKSERTGDEAV